MLSLQRAWHLEILTASVLLVLKSFTKKQLTTKSRDNKSDFTSGHASKRYINEGKHLLDNNIVTQHLHLLLYRIFQK